MNQLATEFLCGFWFMNLYNRVSPKTPPLLKGKLMLRNIISGLVSLLFLVTGSLAMAAEAPPIDPNNQVQSLVTQVGKPHMSEVQRKNLQKEATQLATKTWMLVYQKTPTYDQAGLVDKIMEAWEPTQPYDSATQSLAVIFADTGQVDIRVPGDLCSGKDYAKIYRKTQGMLLPRVMSVLKEVDRDYQEQLQRQHKHATTTKESQRQAEVQAKAQKAQLDKELNDARQWQETQVKWLQGLRPAATPSEQTLIDNLLADVRSSKSAVEIYTITSKLTATAEALSQASAERCQNQSFTVNVLTFFTCLVLVGFMRVRSHMTDHEVYRALIVDMGKQAEALANSLPGLSQFARFTDKVGETAQRFDFAKGAVLQAARQLQELAQQRETKLRLVHLTAADILELMALQFEAEKLTVLAQAGWTTFTTDFDRAEQSDLREVMKDPGPFVKDSLAKIWTLWDLANHDQILMDMPWLRGEILSVQKSDPLGAEARTHTLRAIAQEVREDFIKLQGLYRRATERQSQQYVNSLIERCKDKGLTRKQIIAILEAVVLFNG